LFVIADFRSVLYSHFLFDDGFTVVQLHLLDSITLKLHVSCPDLKPVQKESPDYPERWRLA